MDQVASALRASSRDVERKGWDSATGYGMLNLAAALALPPPAIDPREPNDDMAWINGRAHRPRRHADLAPRRHRAS